MDSGKQWSLDDFEIGKHLGRGKFGESLLRHSSNQPLELYRICLTHFCRIGSVYLAREKRTKYIVALKVSLQYKMMNCRNTDKNLAF